MADNAAATRLWPELTADEMEAKARDRFKGRHEQWTKGQHRGGHHGLTATTPPEFRDVLLSIARSSSLAVAA